MALGCICSTEQVTMWLTPSSMALDSASACTHQHVSHRRARALLAPVTSSTTSRASWARHNTHRLQ